MRSVTIAAPNGTPTLAESLELLRQWQQKQTPPLPDDLLAYLSAQARFVVSVARQYQNQRVAWPQLLEAGQRALIREWELRQGDPSRLGEMGAWWVRQAMIEQTHNADTTDALARRGNFACHRSGHEVYLYYRGRLIFKKWLQQPPGTSRVFHAGEGLPDASY